MRARPKMWLAGWNDSSSWSGYQEMVGSCSNFGVRLSSSVYTYADGTDDWDTHAVSGVADLVASPLDLCSPASCDDADPCTIDTCNIELGCSYEPVAQPLCGADIPASSNGSRWILALLLCGVGIAALRLSMRHPA